MLRQCLLFPHAPHLLATQARQPMQFRLLMELENGFISYLLIHQRSLPGADDIALIAPTLTEAIQEGYALTHVSDLISERHGLSVQVLDAPFVDINTWQVAQVVNASLASAARQRSGADLSSLRRQWLAETGRDLRVRIEAFLLNLDAEILAAQDRNDWLPSHYNYLVGGNPVLRRNRLQALRATPWLMRHVLWNDHQAALAQRVRQAIDYGSPLVSDLAEGLAVSPSTVKSLGTCPLLLLASVWRGNIPRLAQALNSITPEFRPRNGDQWARMGDAVTTIEQVTGHAISRSQNLLWLAAAARRGFVVRVPEMQEMAALTVGLADMRHALSDILALRLGRHQILPADWLARNPAGATAIFTVIARAFARVEFSRLLDIVRRWQDAFRRHQANNDEDSALIRGLTWRAPLDGFQTENRFIVPLLSQSELVEDPRFCATRSVAPSCLNACIPPANKECTMKPQDKKVLSSKQLLERIGISHEQMGNSLNLLDEEADLGGDLTALLRERYYQLKEVRHVLKPGMVVTWKPGLKNRRWPVYGQPGIVVALLETPVFDTDEAGSTYFRESLDIVIGIFLDAGEHRGEFLVFHTSAERYQPWPGEEA